MSGQLKIVSTVSSANGSWKAEGRAAAPSPKASGPAVGVRKAKNGAASTSASNTQIVCEGDRCERKSVSAAAPSAAAPAVAAPVTSAQLGSNEGLGSTAPAAAVALLGEELLLESGDAAGKTAGMISPHARLIGLYFSAHWCPPCRHFTPALAEAYKAHDYKSKGMEVVFISSDRDEASAASYHGEMPWLMLPYEQKRNGTMTESLKEISNSVRGIPTLVLVDAVTGEVVDRNGRAKVTSDPTGSWIAELGSAPAVAATAKPLAAAQNVSSAVSDTTNDETPRNAADVTPAVAVERKEEAVKKSGSEPAQKERDTFNRTHGALIENEPLLTRDGKGATLSYYNRKKVTALYFSAHWCGPCRRFTPALAKVYEELRAEGYGEGEFEIVFLSSDRDEAAFRSYYQEMPWAAMTFADSGRQKKAALSNEFHVSGIPTLTVLDADYQTIDLDADIGSFAKCIRERCTKQ